MKKALILLPVMALAACDKPTTDIELDCGQAYQESETIVRVKTYDDKAIIQINGGEKITLNRKESEREPSLTSQYFEYEGNMPAGNEPVEFGFHLDKVTGSVRYYDISFEPKRGGWNCHPLNKFNGKYDKPSKVELCIEEICNNVFFESDEVKPGEPRKLVITKNINEYNGTRSSVKFYTESFVIPQEDALAISKNWDYKNMKPYTNEDNEIKPHEKDACEVADRLQKYIKSKGFDKTSYVYKMNKNLLQSHADWPWLKNKAIESSQNGYVDIRSVNASSADLSVYETGKISFDRNTVFPSDASKLPAGFDAKKIADAHRNPGLNVRKLHEMGIDGRGVSMAIIDQKLAPHQEYNDNLAWYSEDAINEENMERSGSMHGSAVASIAVGKTVGVAPGAKLYYFASDLTDGTAPEDKDNADETSIRTSRYYARALREILEMNRKLPDNEKIVVVSVSGAPGWSKDPGFWEQVLEEAKEAGVFVTTTELEKEYNLHDNGLDRDVFGDPDDPMSYRVTSWQLEQKPSLEIQKQVLCFPMDHRTTAAPNGNADYVHYADGGWSWMKPFEAGLYVLAKQVKPSVTPEEFFLVGLETGTYSEKAKCVIVNPVALIQKLQ